ncbi:UDP-glucuronosyltransferase 3A1-like [Suricata suricatta]|uniref:UDP-glucuronosyltransferase 3A1-like n=1 Tax=Suricata suricatta TaxID=37032 RepID=UPI00115589FE|nr:UDP-glucuronosyltransferase 3A1-like [Suricata suricatta]
MERQQALLLAGFFLPGFLLSEAAKILTAFALGASHSTLFESEFKSSAERETMSCPLQGMAGTFRGTSLKCQGVQQLLVENGKKSRPSYFSAIITPLSLHPFLAQVKGGSHYLLLDRVSEILQDHGHNVTMLSYGEEFLIPDIEKGEASYEVISWLPPEDHKKEFKKCFEFFVTEALHGRETFDNFVKLLEQLGIRCSDLLRRSDIMDFLKNENFDLVFVEAFDFCSLLVAEKLGKPFVSILPTQFGSVDHGLPSPVSYVPVFRSLLTDHMDFVGRVKNFLMFFDFFMKKWQIQSAFDNAIKEHFPEDSRPVLSHLLKKAELWFVNSDFALEFARPLLPNTVYVGGLLARPVKLVPQEFENFISKFGDSGFVLVALGSMVSTYQSQEVLMEMNSAFAHLSQGVIWKCKPSHWPKDVKLAGNVKIVDWLPQNDLLGSVTTPSPFLSVLIYCASLTLESREYKSAAVAASIIRRSHPLTPAQRLVGWIDHILQTGGAAHLKAHALQQPWHEQYLLDVILFLLVVTLGTLWLCGKLLGMVVRWLCGARKLKKT